jgi:hypothetical protein
VTGPTFSNINPNVRVAGYRISDGYRTCNKRIEAAEISIGDRMMTPAMAPVVLENINGSDYTLPIVVMDILSDGDNPVNFYYIGQLAVFCNPEFVDPSTLNLRWQFGNGCYDSLPCTLGLDAPSTDIRFFVYPNPAEDQLNFVLQSGEAIHEVYVTNLLGETVQTVNRENLLLSGEPNTINTHHLPNGIYLLNMQTAYGLYGQKFVVNK